MEEEEETDWFTEDPPTQSAPPQQQVRVDVLDATASLSGANQTLSVRNTLECGWQKQVLCTIEYCNELYLSTIMSSRIHHSYAVSKVLIWLAYEDALFSPLCCGVHIDPFTNLALRRDRITFHLKCEAACYATKQLCIVVVEYHAGRRYQWNYTHGHFRTRQQQQPTPTLDPTPPLSFVVAQIHEMSNKMDTLTKEVRMLQHLIYQVLSVQQQQQQQDTPTHTNK